MEGWRKRRKGGKRGERRKRTSRRCGVGKGAREKESEREKAREEQRVCVFEDRRGTEINCGGVSRETRG